MRGRERVGQAALNNGAALQELPGPGHDDRRDRDPEHRPPPAGRQAAVRKEQNKDDQRRDHQILCAAAKRGDLPGRRQRAGRRGQAAQAVLLQEHAHRQQQADQREEPADRVAGNPGRDQPPDAGVDNDRDHGEDVRADPGGGHHPRVEREQHQRPGEDQQDEPGQSPGQGARAWAAGGLVGHVADCGDRGPGRPGWRQHHDRRASFPPASAGLTGPAGQQGTTGRRRYRPGVLLRPLLGRGRLARAAPAATVGAGAPPGRARGWP